MAKQRRKRGKTRTNSHCDDCPAKCCYKLLVPFNKPRTRADLDYYKWHLHYDTVAIVVRARRWYLAVEGRCIYLDDKELCTIYDRRPEICRDHNPPDCEHFGKWYDQIYATPEELEKYFEREKRKRRLQRRKAAANKGGVRCSRS